MPVEPVPDVDADGNLVTQQGQAADKKKTKNMTIAGIALGAVAIAVTIYIHGKSGSSASNTATTPDTVTSGVGGTGAVFPGGDATYGSGGGDILSNSSLFATQSTTENNEFAAINQALATIATQNQAIGTYETGLGKQNQAIGTMLLTGQTPGGTKLPSTK